MFVTASFASACTFSAEPFAAKRVGSVRPVFLVCSLPLSLEKSGALTSGLNNFSIFLAKSTIGDVLGSITGGATVPNDFLVNSLASSDFPPAKFLTSDF